jgi:hypothetical protein
MKFSILFLTGFFSVNSAVASYACFVEGSSYNYQAWNYNQALNPQALQCTTTKNFGLGLTAIGLSLQTGALYMACTGVGAPASLWVQGASLGVSVVSMVVGELPCEDTDSDERVKELAKKTVCETLALNGIACAIK